MTAQQSTFMIDLHQVGLMLRYFLKSECLFFPLSSYKYTEIIRDGPLFNGTFFSLAFEKMKARCAIVFCTIS